MYSDLSSAEGVDAQISVDNSSGGSLPTSCAVDADVHKVCIYICICV
jgi:hypothetical protein